jgi:Predicted integral membrane protein (DUF2269)
MDVVRAIVAIVHVGSAMLFIVGYVTTGVLTELARRADGADERRQLLSLSGRFDGWFQIPFGTLVGLSGLAAVVVFGHTWTEPWVLLSILAFGAVTFGGAVLWRGRSAKVRQALESGDDLRVRELLSAPAAVIQSRIENVLVALVVVLMILRPA